MMFELTDSIVTEILFAMDNQQETFLLDTESLKIVQADCALCDSENLEALPQWTSSDGYNLLESFVATIRGSRACDELRCVLAEGRGVFKNFKNALKKYPYIERRFNFYKHKQMCLRVIEWYNALREARGLEKLEQNIEECDNLLEEDFQFRPYSQSDFDCAQDGARAIADEIKEQFPNGLGDALSAIWLNRCERALLNQKSGGGNGFVCRSLSDDFAGCLLFDDLSLSSSLKSDLCGAVSLTALFVNRDYRGLGIAGELLSRSVSELRKRGIRFFIIADSVIPERLKAVLTRTGFESSLFAFVNDLFKNRAV